MGENLADKLRRETQASVDAAEAKRRAERAREREREDARVRDRGPAQVQPTLDAVHRQLADAARKGKRELYFVLAWAESDCEASGLVMFQGAELSVHGQAVVDSLVAEGLTVTFGPREYVRAGMGGSYCAASLSIKW